MNGRVLRSAKQHMKRDQKAIALAVRFLEHVGLTANRLPEGKTKTADIEAHDETIQYLVEIKEKSHDPDRLERISQRTSEGDIAYDVEGFAGRAAIATILKNAELQLSSSDPDGSSIRLVWMVVAGFDADLRWQQVYSTFYGAVHVVPRDGRDGVPDQCLYFDHSASFNHPGIDGLFLVQDGELNLCLNEFSARYEMLKSSHLAKSVGSAAIDPKALVRDGIAVALKCSTPRKDDDAVARELEEHTGIDYVPIRIRRHSTYARA